MYSIKILIYSHYGNNKRLSSAFIMKKDYLVLLFYKYVDIENPKQVRDEQIKLCEDLSLKGRIIIAKEGINGTLEGTLEDTQKYIDELHKNKYFKGISFKKSKGEGKSFPKLSIKVRPEIIRLGVPNLNPNKISGKYIIAKQLHKWFEEKKEFFVVDMRNDYEYLSGFFEGSIFSMTHNFFDLPKNLSKLEYLKGKTVVTVCTGGVRCEKASGFLLMNGFCDVYQLKDGIQSYIEKYPNEHFKGKLYVFDNRLTLGFNTESENHEIVGKCMHCLKPSDSYVNCALDSCHFHYICCNNCKDRQTNLAFCKNICKVKYLQSIQAVSQ